MQTVELILFLLVFVISSSLVSRIIPFISLPLIQIGIGVILAIIIGSPVEITLDPELFLVLFIAPLLFNEGKNVDRLGLWNNRKMIFSLAIGLVVVLVLSIGFIMHWFIPSASLAACFALGAALGPTDAVAVTSLSKSVSLSKNQEGVLSGECLINDASGIVSFQFAIAAAMTGAFSIVDAGITFLYSFFGGIIIGVLMGYGMNKFIAFVRQIGLESMTFHVSIEIMLPFIAFLIGEELQTSGILAVVACSLVFDLSPKDASGSSVSRMNIVSSSVWQVLSFFLNGLVFLMLGLQLPSSMESVIENPRFPNISLFEYVLLIIFILVAVRFLWILFMEAFFPEKRLLKTRGRFHLDKDIIRNAALLTFAGPKGAVTLSIAFTLPVAISQRSLLIFIASGAIIGTLVLSNIFVPLLAPSKKKTDEQTKKDYTKARIAILRGVIEKLSEAQENNENIDKRSASAYRSVMQEYSQRIAALKNANDIEDKKNIQLRVQCIHWEEEYTMLMMNAGQIDEEIGYTYLHRMNKMASRIQHKSDTAWLVNNSMRRFRTIIRGIQNFFAEKIPDAIIDTDSKETELQSIKNLQERCITYVLKRLQAELTSNNYPTEDVNNVITEYRNMLLNLQGANPSVTQRIKTDNQVDDIKLQALRYELGLIEQAYEDEKINRNQAKQLRQSVYIMELDAENVI